MRGGLRTAGEQAAEARVFREIGVVVDRIGIADRLRECPRVARIKRDHR
jgi:hypothetical protein